MCCLLVSGLLKEITQEIHSFRASGVMSSHFARAAGSERSIFRKSAGTVCTAPGEMAFLVVDFIFYRLSHPISLGSLRGSSFFVRTQGLRKRRPKNAAESWTLHVAQSAAGRSVPQTVSHFGQFADGPIEFLRLRCKHLPVYARTSDWCEHNRHLIERKACRTP